MSGMPRVWRIEARANPFVPWVVIWPKKDEVIAATREAEQIKRAGRYYAVRVRAN